MSTFKAAAAVIGQDTPLCEVSRRYKADKGPLCHGYTRHYYAAFCALAAKTRVVLEIGIGCPGSTFTSSVVGQSKAAGLLMWRDFFPNAQIHGVDIDPRALLESDRIHSHLADQADAAAMRQLGHDFGPFDIIIDDGSHQPEHQVHTVAVLWEYLMPGGIYVIEDIRPSSYGDVLQRALAATGTRRYTAAASDRATPDGREQMLVLYKT